ncbi:30S ribosomal protein S17 [Candidatus Roizmanbacteria bacterium RIFCSPHIGHO2_01_FULL_39_12b]|uniref:Small ribosomal subunit protein uS17 n=1 Tax=Candidatus Roizmanbacteria bacterium RIFCSPHIGHO2_01_FULL_39_12b TaxID=1802030 RepID=A0A1F7GC05_9BACT|nr:MAG: 30S ribosomal protein S17 [Candidatus Roizmanbacteria bacterium RIFCSPHIGHO2_01_FULL_39_12b]OGK47099.1 MAG: 30S ribosomal protein S17 [Candidatus Roizmanbacteria bacterium RIFCSPLOWO2_01_FULL_39_19]
MAAKTFIGKIVSAKMQNTVSVEVERAYRHKLYKKTIVRHKKYLADTNDHTITEGAIVKIQECRPISKNKRFRVIEKLTS